MSQHFAMKYLLLACCAILAGCGGVGMKPIAKDGIYLCLEIRPIDPANCSPAIVRVCNDTATEKWVRVEGVGIRDIKVPAYATVYTGPFVGYTEYKDSFSGACRSHQYTLTILPQ